MVSDEEYTFVTLKLSPETSRLPGHFFLASSHAIRCCAEDIPRPDASHRSCTVFPWEISRLTIEQLFELWIAKEHFQIILL